MPLLFFCIIQASLTQNLDHPYRSPYFETATHTMSLAKPSSPDVKTASQLKVKKRDKALPCEGEKSIFIQYTVVGEIKGSVDVMYLVSAGISHLDIKAFSDGCEDNYGDWIIQRSMLFCATLKLASPHNLYILYMESTGFM